MEIGPATPPSEQKRRNDQANKERSERIAAQREADELAVAAMEFLAGELFDEDGNIILINKGDNPSVQSAPEVQPSPAAPVASKSRSKASSKASSSKSRSNAAQLNKTKKTTPKKKIKARPDPILSYQTDADGEVVAWHFTPQVGPHVPKGATPKKRPVAAPKKKREPGRKRQYKNTTMVPIDDQLARQIFQNQKVWKKQYREYCANRDPDSFDPEVDSWPSSESDPELSFEESVHRMATRPAKKQTTTQVEYNNDGTVKVVNEDEIRKGNLVFSRRQIREYFDEDDEDDVIAYIERLMAAGPPPPPPKKSRTQRAVNKTRKFVKRASRGIIKKKESPKKQVTPLKMRREKPPEFRLALARPAMSDVEEQPSPARPASHTAASKARRKSRK